MIIENKAQCLRCGDIIESTHIHDFRWCSCGSLSVDGGKSYLKRSGNPSECIDLSIIEDDKDLTSDIFEEMGKIRLEGNCLENSRA